MSAIQKKRRELINKGPKLVPAVRFGTYWPLHHKHLSLPDAIGNPREFLEKHSLATLLLWGILHHCMDTSTGKVCLFPITVATSNTIIQGYIGHWSMVQQVMINLFTGFRNGVKQKDIHNALIGLMMGSISQYDLGALISVTGTKKVNRPRLFEHSHFIIPADLLHELAPILQPFKDPKEFLYSEATSTTHFCTDKSFTLERLKHMNLFISATTVTTVFQSNTPNWLMYKLQPLEYNDLTPAFGITHWDTLLDIQFDAYRKYHKCASPAFHMISFYEISKGIPVETRDQVWARFPYGVIHDIPEDRYTDHNQAAKRRRGLQSELLASQGLVLPGPGRPRSCEKPIRDKLKTTMKMVEIASGIRPMKRNRTDRSDIKLEDIRQSLPKTAVTPFMTPSDIQRWMDEHL